MNILFLVIFILSIILITVVIILLLVNKTSSNNTTKSAVDYAYWLNKANNSGNTYSSSSCAAGQYMSDNNVCTQCPEGSTSPLGTMAKTDCKCIPNYYSNADNVCIKCPAMSTSGPESIDIMSCKCTDNSTMINNKCVCNSGYFEESEKCVSCIDRYGPSSAEAITCVAESIQKR